MQNLVRNCFKHYTVALEIINLNEAGAVTRSEDAVDHKILRGLPGTGEALALINHDCLVIGIFVTPIKRFSGTNDKIANTNSIVKEE